MSRGVTGKGPHVMTCPQCNGQRLIPLHDALQDTLDTLLRLGPSSATEIWRALPRSHVQSVMSINNRLAELKRLGFAVVTQKRGKTLIYEATKRTRSL